MFKSDIIMSETALEIYCPKNMLSMEVQKIKRWV
jgi:hypothetical protein